MKKRPWKYIFLFLILILAAQLLLPVVAERKLNKIILSQVEEIGELDIELVSFPSMEILLGKIDFVEISAEKPVYQDLLIRSLDVKYRDVLLKGNTFEGENTYLRILITEDDLNNYLKHTSPDLADLKISLKPDQVLLVGKVPFLNTSLNLRITGGFLVKNEENKVVFQPEEMKVERVNIPVNLLSKYIEDAYFTLDLNQLNFPLEIDKVKVEEGQIIIANDG
ncbi:DUF2993 domain-containing protein [Iocasia frigidifontis]|uniref:DUF2993 domain-containing protein n=1 Tax=Iocasia fonsfrigidae TaxID=2682810 RepID=A0A8A7K6K3_9FIRM|nr:DUF2993 domain-containing protein [Iocasia fonsfrigidae]QTL97001.1 DUF2993 domain-containing protein [Iocasia fonsfrigidae]